MSLRVIMAGWALLALGCSARELGFSTDSAESESESESEGDGGLGSEDGDGDGDGDGELDPCASPELCNNGDAVEVLARYFYAFSHMGSPQTCAEQVELAWAITGWSDHRVACLEDHGCSEHASEADCVAACERQFATCMDGSGCDANCVASYADCEAACGATCSAAERWACTLALPYDDAGELGCAGTVEGALGRAEIAESLATCLAEQRGCASTVDALHCEADADEALAACDEISVCAELDACWQEADEHQAACLGAAG